MCLNLTYTRARARIYRINIINKCSSRDHSIIFNRNML